MHCKEILVTKDSLIRDQHERKTVLAYSCWQGHESLAGGIRWIDGQKHVDITTKFLQHSSKFPQRTQSHALSRLSKHAEASLTCTQDFL